MGEITGDGLMLEGAALEDARRIIAWAIRDSADCLRDAEAGAVSDHLTLLLERARVGGLLGEPGEPDEGQPLGAQDRRIVAEAAELLADMSACFVADEPEDRARVTFHEARLDLAWRVLLLVEPPEWTT